MPANDYLRDTSLVNEEVKEILGTPPAWIARVGNMVLLAVVGIFIALAFYISYPDIIVGRAIISPNENPVPVVLASQAILKKICVADGGEVRAGQVLLYFQKLGGGAADSILAGINGKVVIERVALDNQRVGADTLIMTIVPVNETYTGLISISPAGAGKICPGQKVMVYLDNYPGSEFGALKGIVLNRPGCRRDKQLTVSVKIRSGQTTYRKYPVITGPMEGHVEIVTADKKLITQLWPF